MNTLRSTLTWLVMIRLPVSSCVALSRRIGRQGAAPSPPVSPL